ncbi:MAG: class I SAM-dependent methyltransferase [Puia sp.]|nr:class I SAM-dependent methyltransferase [Puia sp.]
MSNSTTRFSDRVGDYTKYRPHYPKRILPYLEQETGFNAASTIADIGSGTGISTEPFLENGNKVYAVEPNREMRAKAEELLGSYARFISIDGTAEETGLGKASVDLIVAGQAFHWFDRTKTKTEFERISGPGAYAALIWNERLISSAFEIDYEALILHYGSDYKTINHKNIQDEEIAAFFAPRPSTLRIFENEQLFDLEGLTGRLRSSSYIPNESDPAYKAMVRDLENLFGKYNSGGRIRIGYETKLYLGKIG